MQDKVNILLATYNGAKYLREQLESVDAQTLRAHRVTIRDDGSTDDTNAIVERWADGRNNVLRLRGPRLGVANNFFAVLANPDAESDYFAFADQDDVWLPHKMERAVEALRGYPSDEPLVYCTKVEYVDESLRHLAYAKTPKGAGFANALVENIATGCTIVLNRSARELVCGRLPERALIHDWWCYMAISALGKVIYDERPSVKYRQHTNNVTGAATTEWDLFRRRFVRFLKHKRGARLMSDQAIEFQRCFGNILSPQNRKTLERFLSVRGSFRERVSYNAVMDVWRQRWADTMILRALILMGRV